MKYFFIGLFDLKNQERRNLECLTKNHADFVTFINSGFYRVERLFFYLKRHQRHFSAYFICKAENKEISNF